MTDDDAKAAVERVREELRVFDDESIDRDPLPSFEDLRTLLAHLDGEAARTQAACDRRAEEVREACALRAGAGDPEDHDHSKAVPCWWCAKANEVRETPLDSTPLGDEVRALRARVAELEAQAAKDDAHVVEVNDAHLKQVAALRARVAELERAEKTLDAVCAVLGREVGNRGDSEGAVDVAERLIRERDEAVAALRGLLRDEWYTYEGNLEASGRASVDDLNAARAVLAKYPEGR